MFYFINKRFIDGLTIVLPIAAAITIIKFIVSLLSKWLYPIHHLFKNKLINIPYSEFLIAYVIIFTIGLILKELRLEDIYSFIEEKIIKKIPLFNSLYFGIKKVLIIIFKQSKENNESKLVAWVKLPYKNIYCLGLMTTKLDPSLAPEKDKEFYCFFIPTTPNPMVGYYIIVEKKDCVFTSLSREEAISMIVSGGIIKPENEIKKEEK